VNWQPIATAPKETTIALVAEPPFTPGAGWRMLVCIGHGDCWVHMGSYLKPTHWMPLVAPGEERDACIVCLDVLEPRPAYHYCDRCGEAEAEDVYHHGYEGSQSQADGRRGEHDD
jgi:hypothetical protein